MAIVSNNILITFDMLVDIDIGLLDIVKKSYNDPSVFRKDIFELDDNRIKGLLRENNYRNPLSIVLFGNSTAQADAYYKEFMEYEYDNIVDTAPITTMVDVVKTFIDSEGAIIPSILCKTRSEYVRVEEIFVDCLPNLFNIIFSNDHSLLDISQYDTFFLKYIEDLSIFNPDTISGKNLIISDYRCNLDEEKYVEKKKIPKAEYLLMFAGFNEFRTVTLYHYDESYYEEEKEDDEIIEGE